MALYTLGSLPHGSVAERWNAPAPVAENASGWGAVAFPGAEPFARVPERPAVLPRSDGLSLVVPEVGSPADVMASPEVAVSTSLASVGAVAGLDVGRLLERYPWLAPIGAEKLSLLLRTSDIENYGVWAACGRLGLYSQCVQACRDSGTGCRPE